MLPTIQSHPVAAVPGMIQWPGKNGRNGNHNLIELRDLVKVYQTPAGDFPALKGIHLSVEPGEFVVVVGKSGSGKTTMINMLTGIDRPTSGEVIVGGVPIHKLDENQMSRWRGRNLGVVFQFFQLLPTLTILENITLPMDLCNAYPLRERKARAMHLLEQRSPRMPTSCHPSYPEANNNEPPSPAPWPTIRPSWRPTNRPGTLTHARPARSSSCSRPWWSKARLYWWSHTTTTLPPRPHALLNWPTAGC